MIFKRLNTFNYKPITILTLIIVLLLNFTNKFDNILYTLFEILAILWVLLFLLFLLYKRDNFKKKQFILFLYILFVFILHISFVGTLLFLNRVDYSKMYITYIISIFLSISVIISVLVEVNSSKKQRDFLNEDPKINKILSTFDNIIHYEDLTSNISYLENLDDYTLIKVNEDILEGYLSNEKILSMIYNKTLDELYYFSSAINFINNLNKLFLQINLKYISLSFNKSQNELEKKLKKMILLLSKLNHNLIIYIESNDTKFINNTKDIFDNYYNIKNIHVVINNK